MRIKFILLASYHLKHCSRVNIKCYVNLVVRNTEIIPRKRLSLQGVEFETDVFYHRKRKKMLTHDLE